MIAIAEYNAAKIAALNQVFDKVDSTNFAQIIVTVDLLAGTIKLTANLVYTFGRLEGYEITSNEPIIPELLLIKGNFKLLPKAASETAVTIEEVTIEEVKGISFNAENIDSRKLEIIKKIFNLGNVSDDMIMNGLQVKKSTTKVPGAYTLILVAKLGYTINR